MRSKAQEMFNSFKGSIPKNYIDSQKPNFYTELCCEWSGDAAREVDRLSNRAIARSEGSSAVPGVTKASSL